jgi:hypothetical protein
MVQVQLIKNVIPEEIPLAITNRKNINFAFHNEHNQCCRSACHSNLRIFLKELIIEFKECFIHKNLHHFIHVSSLI